MDKLEKDKITQVKTLEDLFFYTLYGFKKFYNFCTISTDASNRIYDSLNINVSGFNINLIYHHLIHFYNSHFDSAEKDINQKPIEFSDIKLIGTIVNEFDTVRFGKEVNNEIRLFFTKKFPNNLIYELIVVVDNKHNNLSGKSFRIKRARLSGALAENSPVFTSETGLDFNSADKVTSKSSNSQASTRKTFLGATEILESNSATLDFKGFQPTYQLLDSYDHLIEHSPNKVLNLQYGGFELTKANILQITKQYSYQVAALAKHLYSSNQTQACFNIWHFIKTNIKYSLDTASTEEIRTPSRSWLDRFTGIDCEDMAIFSAACLINMGYNPMFYIVNFNYKPDPGHIYTVSDNTVLDGVMNKFNTHPDFITKTMKIYALNGVPLSGTSSDDAVFDYFAKLRNEARSQSPINGPSLRKIEYIMGLESPVRNEMLPIMPHVSDMRNGKLMFRSNNINRVLYGDGSVAGLGSVVDDDDATAALLSGLNDDELDVIEGIANIGFNLYPDADDDETIQGLGGFDGLGSLGKGFLKKAVKKVGKGIKKVAKKVAKVGLKVLKVLNKINPVTMAIRGAMLLAMRKNTKGFAKRLSYGYMSTAQAQAKKLNLAEHAKHVQALKKTEKWFEALGGSTSKMKQAILKGSGGLKGISGIYDNADADDYIEGLGFIADIAKAVTSIFGFLGKLFKKKGAAGGGADSDKLVEQSPEEKALLNSAPEGSVEQLNTEASNLNIDTNNNTIKLKKSATNSTESSSSNTPLIIGGGIAAALALFFIIKK